MGLDIKIPIGLMFSLLGLILTIQGLATIGNTELYQKSLNININLWLGLTLLVFGVLMLVFSKKKPEEKNAEQGRADS